jgi:hypothetical protein
MSDLEKLHREKPITKPPGRWRNRYRNGALGYRMGSEPRRAPGEIFDGNTVFLSKDIAETVAQEFLAGCFNCGSPRAAHIEYLGAFPVEAP